MVRERKNKYFDRVLISFIIANVIFILIFVVADVVSYYNYKGIERQNNLIEQYVAQMSKTIESQVCGEMALVESSEMLQEVSVLLGVLEQRFGKNDLRVLEQKVLYTELEYGHFKVVEFLNKNCSSHFVTIFFFYSNSGDLEKDSERAGRVLNSFKQKYTSEVMIYSFDSELDSEIINSLKSEFNVTYAPIAVVNQQDKFYPYNVDLLEKYITR